MGKFKLLFLVILIATFLRFYQIDSNPKAMYGDELTGVYDAYSILKTGHDQKGNFLPLVFPLGGATAGYVYVTVPFVAIFGPTPLSARMTSVLLGIGIVILLYFLGKHFFSKEAGLAIAAIAALSPWELSMSRGAFETHFALFLSLLGFWAYLQGFKKKYWFLVFGLAFTLASQTYSTYRLIIPLFTVVLLVWKKRDILENIRKPLLLIALALITASTILGIYLTISRGKEDRFDIINIFNDQNLRATISQKVNSDRILDSLPRPISNIMHTPQAELVGVLAENYLGNFLPDFLFLHGDGNPRHNPAEMGQFYWIDLILLLSGITYLLKKNKSLLALLIAWSMIAPIPTTLVGGAHALRSSFLLIPLLIISGIGLFGLWRSKKNLLIIFLTAVFLIQFIYFVDRFYFLAPQKNVRFWSYPAKEAYLLADKNRQKFDFVILSNDIDNMEFAYPAYAKLDPNLVIAQNKSRTKIGEFPFFKYNNVYIGSLPNTRIMQFIKDLPGSALYIGTATEQPYLENYSIIQGFDKQPDVVVVTNKTIVKP